MKIMVMRHADALGKAAAAVEYDAERPLSDRGRVDAQRVGAALLALGCAPADLLSSPLIRSQETAAIVAEAVGGDPQAVIPLSVLSPGSGPDELLRAVSTHGDAEHDWVLAVMHEPDVSHILGVTLFGGRECPLPVYPGDLFALDLQSAGGHTRASLAFALSQTVLDRLLRND
jgi:phosphohistidine phosphatase